MKTELVAIVTGGGSGIGRGICAALAQDGTRVIPADLKFDAAQKTARLIDDQGREAWPLEVDVTDKSSVAKMIGSVMDRYKRIDILVNNAGMDKKDWIWDIREEDWDRIMSLNLKGVFLCTQAVSEHMKVQRFGRIINISSIAGKTGESRTSAYCTSKFGVIGFTQSVALELAEYGITVNAVCPAAVETDMVKSRTLEACAISGRSYAEELYDSIVKYNPVGRIASVDDIAHAVRFLADKKSDFITGSTLNVAGGREMH